MARCDPVARSVERFFHSGVGLTNAYTCVPETVSRRCRVCGVAPARSQMWVTTPLRPDEADELLPEDVLPLLRLPEALAPLLALPLNEHRRRSCSMKSAWARACYCSTGSA